MRECVSTASNLHKTRPHHVHVTSFSRARLFAHTLVLEHAQEDQAKLRT